MKILKLNFKNIHSLKGENTVDFTKYPLSEAGIFAIIGPTGSGKSTLLDIITLALYNQTPRIGTLSKNEVKSKGSIITRNTDDCYAEVEYQINSKQYRSKWEISTARTGELRDYTMELSELPEGNLITDKKGEVPNLNTQIIGLNYEQFIKSIVLSQGEFAKFLKATPSERSELLEKITGTEIFRLIGKAAYDKQKEEKIKLDNLEIKLKSIDVLGEDEIKSLNETNKNLENEIIICNKTIVEFSKFLSLKENILSYEKKKKSVENEFNKIENELKNFEKSKLKLEKHELLQNLKTDIFEINNLYDYLKDIENKYIIEKKKYSELNITKNEIGLKINQLSQKKIDLENEFNITIPKIKKARELDFKIESINSKIQDIRESFKNKSDAFKIATSEYDNLQKKNQNDKNLLQKKENWISDNLIIEELEKEFSLIEEKISSFDNVQKEILNYINKFGDNQIFKDLKTLIDWNKKLSLLKEKSIKFQQEKKNFENELKFSVEQKYDLEEKLEQLKIIYEGLKNQQLNSELFLKNKSKIDEISLKNQELIDLNKKLNKKISDNFERIEIAEKYLEELKIRKERQQLEAKYDHDRTKLSQGEACFLCGSKEHPYVINYKNELDETTKILKNKELELKKLILENQKTTNQITEYESILKTNINIVQDLSTENDNIKSNFAELNKSHQFLLNIDNIEGIKNQIEKNIEEGKTIKNQINIISKIVDINNSINILENIIEKLSIFVEKENQVKLILKKYEKYIKNETKTSQVKTILKEIIDVYTKEKEATSNLKNEIFSVEKLIEEKSKQIEILKSELILQKEELETKKSENETIKKERFELVKEEHLDVVEENINQLIKDNLENLNKLKNDLTTVITNEENCLKNINSFEFEKDNKLKTIAEKENILLPKLQLSGFENIADAQKSILTEEEARQIKNKLDELHDHKTSVLQSIKDIYAELEKFNIEDTSEMKIGKLIEEIDNQKNKIEISNREIGIIKNKLEENTKRNKTIISLKEDFKAQEKEFVRWNTLNELIGDAQGKKFTAYAQQITLNHLINLANLHLTKLNDRYILKKSQNSIKENLIVIDTYMGNSERSVQTLSGGESFLLSLALAIGLSDLASKNTRIECLFIDEGFGTLDQQTLDSALATLEELQSQTKRSIGIISHVQAIKERITTQIELKKVNSGHSTLEII